MSLHVSKQLSEIFYDSGKNLHAYILSDAEKFYTILSYNIENFHGCNLVLSDSIEPWKIAHACFTKYVQPNFRYGDELFISAILSL